MAKYLLVGQADHDNFGDSLIYYCYLSMLRDAGHDADILNASNKFIDRIAYLNMPVNSVSEKNLAKIQSRYNGIIFIPGGYFGCPDFTDVMWQKKWIKSDYFKSIFESIDKLSIPVYVHGAEVGPFAKPLVFKYFKNVICTARKVYVRNLGSSLYIKKNMNIQSEVLPDFIFSLKKFFGEMESNKKFKLGIHITGKVFADNFLARKFMSTLIDVINGNKIDSVLLFSDQNIPDRFRKSLDFFKNSLDNAVNLEVRDYDDMPSVILNASECDTLLTSKLHVGVTGLVYNAKVLCIASHPKLERFYQDNKLSQYYLNYFLTSVRTKKEKINEVLNVSFDKYRSEVLKSNIDNALSIYTKTLESIVSDSLQEVKN
ncbi:TPA: polysaccharide pyruvyl transferase family protein [Raoultella ornithinolytica]|uniref:polysaccharide pyruvyl transferase family protein n=1 Tax=Raoultella ornithinolytica TaxID=54291 RepID=UPI0004D832E3|nr:polysaccharide pyruvyl transferase family protein [Raoultella ornithinolytica]KDV93011.1 polysaccharide pyruvyl transferase family protein [Raoultella ornithinolytica 2-156-04_S1_C1]KDX13254.1 polysaccharide pyruvyl transferase family protein [Raoultella ornithinolytica 2-156-04_S1_C2]